eukprot:254599-Rhodomonas_salina.1
MEAIGKLLLDSSLTHSVACFIRGISYRLLEPIFCPANNDFSGWKQCFDEVQDELGSWKGQ